MSRVRVQSRVVESRKIINNRETANGKLQIGVWCLNYKTICIGNSMVSSAIWKTHARVSFSETIEIARVRRTSAI